MKLMKKTTVMAAVFFLLLFPYLCFASNLFFPSITYQTGYSSGHAVAIGDVNSDGRSDVVVAVYSKVLLVYLQNAMGALDAPIQYTTSPGIRSLVIADFNSDGRNDIVLGELDYDAAGQVIGNIEVFLQNASGRFETGIKYPSANPANNIRISDLNNDGRLDVIGVSWRYVDLFFQKSDGSLLPPVTYELSPAGNGEVESVETGDINNDGLKDIIVLNANSFIGVLLQMPSGLFAPPINYPTDIGVLATGWGLAVGDINGDGLDEVIVTYDRNWPRSKIGIFQQDGSGTLVLSKIYDSWDMPRPIKLADINNDGRLDVVVYHDAWKNVGVYIQGSDGTLFPEELYNTPYLYVSRPQSLAVGDINGDSLNDVAIVDNNGSLTLLYHRTEAGYPDITAPTKIDVSNGYIGSVYNGEGSVALRNVGLQNLYINQVTLSGPDSAEFKITVDTCSGKPVEFTSVCSIDIQLEPFLPGPKSAVLNIASNDPDTPLLSIPIYSCATYVMPSLFEEPLIVGHVGSFPEVVAIGDVNNDGRNDVVMATTYYDDAENDYHIHVFLQNNFSKLSPPVKYRTNSVYGKFTRSIEVGDVNNDGLNDVVVGNAGRNFEVFLQNASGTLSPGISYPTINSFAIKIADLNNDGLLDIVGIAPRLLDINNHEVAIFHQNSQGTFNIPIYYDVFIPILPTGTPLTILDVNDDSLNDIIITLSNSFISFLQNSDGTFGTPVTYPWSEMVSIFLQNNSENVIDIGAYKMTDVNQDTIKDFLAAYSYALAVYPSDYYCQYPMEYYLILDGTSGFTIGDINNDGLPDVAAANHNRGLVVLYHKPISKSILVTPNGGERIPAGSQYTIRWRALPNAVKFKLLYSLDNGITWKLIARNVTGSSYTWKVPNPRNNKKYCHIKVVSYDANNVKVGNDKSDTSFTIKVVNPSDQNEIEN